MQPDLRELAELSLQIARDYFGFSPFVTSSYRSWESQTRLWKARERELECRQRTGKADCGIQSYPVNRPGDSAHNFGLAFDSTVEPQHQYLWDVIREVCGFRVPQNDRIHAELPNWRSFVSRTPG